MKQPFWRTNVGYRWFHLVVLGLAALCVAGRLVAKGQGCSDLTVHEWGTFTAVAGKDGEAVEWVPLTPAPDLPGFVEHYSSANFKLGLRGTIRLETPVMYFYSPHEATVSVRLSREFGRASLVGENPPATRFQGRCKCWN
jgi:hypothetical protein